MSEEKKKVGRPKKYESRAERQKAYLERKKQKMKDLEEQVKRLEKQRTVSTNIILESNKETSFTQTQKIAWNKISPSEITIMSTRDLEILIEEFRERIQQYTSFRRTLENITLGIISKNQLVPTEEESSKKIEDIHQQIDENIADLEERMQQQTLLYLMESEIANRQRLEGRRTRIELFETSVEELEKVTKEKVKAKKNV